jgi:hypothetical protein
VAHASARAHLPRGNAEVNREAGLRGPAFFSPIDGSARLTRDHCRNLQSLRMPRSGPR